MDREYILGIYPNNNSISFKSNNTLNFTTLVFLIPFPFSFGWNSTLFYWSCDGHWTRVRLVTIFWMFLAFTRTSIRWYKPKYSNWKIIYSIMGYWIATINQQHLENKKCLVHYCLPVGFFISSDVANDISQCHYVVFGQRESLYFWKLSFDLNVRYNGPQFLNVSDSATENNTNK